MPCTRGRYSGFPGTARWIIEDASYEELHHIRLILEHTPGDHVMDQGDVFRLQTLPIPPWDLRDAAGVDSYLHRLRSVCHMARLFMEDYLANHEELHPAGGMIWKCIVLPAQEAEHNTLRLLNALPIGSMMLNLPQPWWMPPPGGPGPRPSPPDSDASDSDAPYSLPGTPMRGVLGIEEGVAPGTPSRSGLLR